jgi:hypothetical protein
MVVSLGETPAVAWEIDKLRQLGELRKTVFLVPPVAPRSERVRLEILAKSLVSTQGG